MYLQATGGSNLFPATYAVLELLSCCSNLGLRFADHQSRSLFRSNVRCQAISQRAIFRPRSRRLRGCFLRRTFRSQFWVGPIHSSCWIPPPRVASPWWPRWGLSLLSAVFPCCHKVFPLLSAALSQQSLVHQMIRSVCRTRSCYPLVGVPKAPMMMMMMRHCGFE